MLDLERLPPFILANLRERLGLEGDDPSKDETIALYSFEEAFEEYCNWHGLIGWSRTLAIVMSSIKNAEKE